jgi:hypothetical protein
MVQYLLERRFRGRKLLDSMRVKTKSQSTNFPSSGLSSFVIVEPRRVATIRAVAAYALTIFTGAFLLFKSNL